MFAARNKKRLVPAIWSFAVCATAQTVQLGLAAGLSKLNLAEQTLA